MSEWGGVSEWVRGGVWASRLHLSELVVTGVTPRHQENEECDRGEYSHTWEPGIDYDSRWWGQGQISGWLNLRAIDLCAIDLSFILFTINRSCVYREQRSGGGQSWAWAGTISCKFWAMNEVQSNQAGDSCIVSQSYIANSCIVSQSYIANS